MSGDSKSRRTKRNVTSNGILLDVVDTDIPDTIASARACSNAPGHRTIEDFDGDHVCVVCGGYATINVAAFRARWTRDVGGPVLPYRQLQRRK